MYCMQCGTEVGDDIRFCPKCGKKLVFESAMSNDLRQMETKKEECKDGSEVIRGNCKSAVFLIMAISLGIGALVSLVMQVIGLIVLFSNLSEIPELGRNFDFSSLTALGTITVLWLIIVEIYSVKMVNAEVHLTVSLFELYLEPGIGNTVLLQGRLENAARRIKRILHSCLCITIGTIGYIIIILFKNSQNLELDEVFELAIFAVVCALWGGFCCQALVLCAGRIRLYQRISSEGYSHYYSNFRTSLYLWIVCIVSFVATLYMRSMFKSDEFEELVEKTNFGATMSLAMISRSLISIAILLSGVIFSMIDREMESESYKEKAAKENHLELGK